MKTIGQRAAMKTIGQRAAELSKVAVRPESAASALGDIDRGSANVRRKERILQHALTANPEGRAARQAQKEFDAAVGSSDRASKRALKRMKPEK